MRRRLARQTFAWPALIAAASVVGLILALLTDGAGHWLATALLAPPVLIAARGLYR